MSGWGAIGRQLHFYLLRNENENGNESEVVLSIRFGLLGCITTLLIGQEPSFPAPALYCFHGLPIKGVKQLRKLAYMTYPILMRQV
jgi:hypothetical protein